MRLVHRVVNEVYFFNKQTNQKMPLFKDITITSRGREVLRVLHAGTTRDDGEQNLSRLHRRCMDAGLSIDMPSLSRLVNELIKGGYVRERREGREKLLAITSTGLLFCPVDEETVAAGEMLR